MAARATVVRLGVLSKPSTTAACSVVRRAACIAPTQRQYHSSPSWQNVPPVTPKGPPKNPIAASMEKSNAPTGTNTTDPEDDSKNAAFLGEADSDDGFEADVEVNPNAHRHDLSDVTASGLHGQSGEADEPIERERKPQEAIDAEQSAFLGEADSDDAHEADREANPEKYRHKIDDTQHAAYLGEADSNDSDEADREVNPEAYRHRIDDPGSSGEHGQPGEGDEPVEKNR